MKQGIGIVGCGRSGTSFLIKILHANGVEVGNCTGGTLENLNVRAINDAYLADHYNAIVRSGTPYGNLPQEEIIVPDTAIHSHAEDVIEDLKSRSNNYFAFKDPRTTILHDIWIKHVDIVIGVFRNPHEVSESYMKLLSPYYNESEKENGYSVMLDYWLRFNQSLLHVFKNTDKPKFMLEFDDTINEQIANLFESLDLIKYNISHDFNPSLKHENQSLNLSDKRLSDTYEQLLKWRNF
jgi:hypothetical protein